MSRRSGSPWFASAIGAAVLLAGTTADASTRAGATLAPRIMAGALAGGPSYSVALCDGKDPADCTGICGGTLVAPNLVVTSRHCADVLATESLECATYRFSGTLRPPERVWVTAAATVASTAPFQQGLRWDVPRASSCGHDLAFLTLQAPFGAADAPALPAVAHDAVRASAGARLAAHGYGRTAAGDPPDGRRRVVETTVLCVGGADACSGVPGGADLLPTEFAVTASVCPGDSGSGVFDAGDRLLGTLARSIGGTGTCGYGVYTRLAPHALLLARVARAASERGGYPAAPWIASAERSGNSEATAPRGVGAPCDDDGDCDTNLCRSDDAGLRWVCVRSCDATCAPSSCKPSDGSDYCFEAPGTVPPDRGCAVAGTRGAGGLASLAGGIVLCAAARRLRRRSTCG